MKSGTGIINVTHVIVEFNQLNTGPPPYIHGRIMVRALLSPASIRESLIVVRKLSRSSPRKRLKVKLSANRVSGTERIKYRRFLVTLNTVYKPQNIGIIINQYVLK